MPPISIIPKSMMAHETTRLRVNSVTRPGSHHIKISDESMAFSSKQGGAGPVSGSSHFKTQQDPVLSSINKNNYIDSTAKHKATINSNEAKYDFAMTPGKHSHAHKAAHSLSPGNNFISKTFDKFNIANSNNHHLKSQPSTNSYKSNVNIHTDKNNNNRSTDLRARLSDSK